MLNLFCRHKKDYFERIPDPAQYDQPIMKAIAYGITAPNAHNSQMWMIDKLSDREMLLYVRHELLETDPPARQQIISAGCFIELLSIGMTGEGYSVNVEYLPQGEYEVKGHQIGSKPVAKISITKDSNIATDIFFDYIYQRQSNRRPYKGEMISHAEFGKIKQLIGKNHSELIFINDKEELRPFLDIFFKAMEIESRTKATHEETRLKFRFSEKERQTKRDGLSLAQSGVDGVLRWIIEKSFKNGDKATWHSDKMIQASLENIGKSIYSSKGIIFFKTKTNTMLDWLLTGSDFARHNLAVTKLGLATSHYNQVIQEYSEMSALQKDFNTLTKLQANEKIQIIVRIGRARPTYKSWRKLVDDFLILPNNVFHRKFQQNGASQSIKHPD
jgi:hypothetical protein